MASEWIRSGAVRFAPDLKALLTPIDRVLPHPDNYNNGDIEEIAESIETNGMVDPILVQRETGYIIGGNHTWMACQELGAEVVPVVWHDCDDIEAKRLMIALNQTARHARPDLGKLHELIEEVRAASLVSTRGLGMSEHDMATIAELAEMRATYEHATWPTLQFKLHPRIVAAFRHLTREADTDPDRFEVLLRLAGWDGK